MHVFCYYPTEIALIINWKYYKVLRLITYFGLYDVHLIEHVSVFLFSKRNEIAMKIAASYTA